MAALVGVHLALAVPLSAAAQDKAKTAPAAQPAAPTAQGAPEQPAPGWSVNCANSGQGLDCKAQQTIILAKTRQLLLRLSIGRGEDGKSMTLLYQLPHGLFNPAGVVTALDAAEGETLPIQTCDATGCYAGSSMAADKFAALLKGAQLTVTFQDLKKQKITVPVPLKGLDEAVKKL